MSLREAGSDVQFANLPEVRPHWLSQLGVETCFSPPESRGRRWVIAGSQPHGNR